MATEYVIEFEETSRYPRLEDENQSGNRRRSTRNYHPVPRMLLEMEAKMPIKDSHRKIQKANRKHSRKSQEICRTRTQRISLILMIELKDVINEVLILVQSQTYPLADSHRKPLICYKRGEQEHYADRCKSENKGFKQKL